MTTGVSPFILPSPELLEEARTFDGEQLEHLRKRAENSLYFFCKGILGYKDMTVGTHGAFCKFIEDTTMQRKMSLMPRATIKTGIGTIADSARIALKNPDHERILIVNEVKDNVEDMFRELKGIFESNELVRLLWPSAIPERFSGPGITWTLDKMNLRRSMSYKEPTFMGIGMGGAVTSKHFTRIKNDDLIGFEAFRSPAKMAEAKAWTDNIESLGISYNETIIEWIGTRWAKLDVYRHVMDTYGDRLKVFRRSMVTDGKLLWPERFDETHIELLQAKPAVWFGQYQNDPLSDVANDFDVKLVQNCVVNADGTWEAFGKKWPRELLDILITVDPNSGKKAAPDEGAVVVSGTTPDGELLVPEAWSGRASPSEFVDKIFSMCRDWRPRLTGMEEAGQQNTRHYFDLKCRSEGLFFFTVDLKHRNVNKEVRIRTALEPIISVGKLAVSMRLSKLRAQIKDFPDIELWDLLDALAYSVEHHRTPQGSVANERNREALLRVMASRNATTGY